MPILLNPNTCEFPPVEYADEDGLLAFGGDLSPKRLVNAYSNGIFPWYSDREPSSNQKSIILWWSPNPRYVLFPEKLHISETMKKVLKKGSFRISVNKAFPEVIRRCKQKTRPGQTGTWITAEMEKAYIELNRLGYAESVEAWCSKTGALVGGLYGVSIGKAFFGESMFAEVANASKSAFITFVQILKKGGCPIIDCQMETEHLKSLGGEYLPRKDFLRLVRKAARKND